MGPKLVWFPGFWLGQLGEWWGHSLRLGGDIILQVWVGCFPPRYLFPVKIRCYQMVCGLRLWHFDTNQLLSPKMAIREKETCFLSNHLLAIKIVLFINIVKHMHYCAFLKGYRIRIQFKNIIINPHTRTQPLGLPCCWSVAQSCLSLCGPLGCSVPGSPAGMLMGWGQGFSQSITLLQALPPKRKD